MGSSFHHCGARATRSCDFCLTLAWAPLVVRELEACWQTEWMDGLCLVCVTVSLTECDYTLSCLVSSLLFCFFFFLFSLVWLCRNSSLSWVFLFGQSKANFCLCSLKKVLFLFLLSKIFDCLSTVTCLECEEIVPPLPICVCRWDGTAYLTHATPTTSLKATEVPASTNG